MKDNKPTGRQSHEDILRFTIELQKQIIYEYTKDSIHKSDPMVLLKQYHRTFQN